jgi:hypothetical protein
VLLCSRKRGVTVRTLRDRYERLRVQFRPEHSLAIRTWPPPALPSGASVVRTPRVARTEALSFLRRREGSGACRGRSAGAEKSWRRLLRGGRQGAVTPRPAPPALPPLAGLFIVLLGWRRIARRSPFEGASFVSRFDSPRRFPAGFSFRHRNPDGRCRVLRTFMSNPCLAGKLEGFSFGVENPRVHLARSLRRETGGDASSAARHSSNRQGGRCARHIEDDWDLPRPAHGHPAILSISEKELHSIARADRSPS